MQAVTSSSDVQWHQPNKNNVCTREQNDRGFTRISILILFSERHDILKMYNDLFFCNTVKFSLQTHVKAREVRLHTKKVHRKSLFSLTLKTKAI